MPLRKREGVRKDEAKSGDLSARSFLGWKKAALHLRMALLLFGKGQFLLLV